MHQNSGVLKPKKSSKLNGDLAWLVAASVLMTPIGAIAHEISDVENNKQQNTNYKSNTIEYRSLIDSLMGYLYFNPKPDEYFRFINNKTVIMDNGQKLHISVKDILVDSVREFDEDATTNSDSYQLGSGVIEITNIKITKNCDYATATPGAVYDKQIVARYIESLNANSPYNLIHELGHGMDYMHPKLKNMTIKQLFQFKLYSELARRAHIWLLRENVMRTVGNIKNAYPFAITFRDKFLSRRDADVMDVPYFWNDKKKYGRIIKQICDNAHAPYLDWVMSASAYAADDALAASVWREFGGASNYYYLMIFATLYDDFKRLGCSGVGLGDAEFDSVISDVFTFNINGQTVKTTDLKSFQNYVSAVMQDPNIKKSIIATESQHAINTGEKQR